MTVAAYVVGSQLPRFLMVANVLLQYPRAGATLFKTWTLLGHYLGLHIPMVYSSAILYVSTYTLSSSQTRTCGRIDAQRSELLFVAPSIPRPSFQRLGSH
ncbi:hypothetical protein AGABI2DRAFT_195431 [Agaricus bisporus var. bisporus H97]|uniref:hypothetical protein n=1 Tax=Agaricus bisporus var. bisporus (strain H97 / ATCC MYA-4626 / FGSC 10389) TaxID=936046 RepID=UPI00029F7773|nr:hypothetical protein AGABI2DRAFT_195431 [Agaricus bisporus var. bisporus H97]EKV43226.1 hypothetical protein AGABI2DRAFT_195431 [Agaricus bisporus var. bisporus H97]